MKTLQMKTLSEEGISSVSSSFGNLPETDHKDGKFRLRRYSVVEVRTTFWDARTEVELTRLPHREFEQDEELNKFQGGDVRDFEEIEDEVLESEGMKEICLAFKEANNLIDGQEVEIHQMRVITSGSELSESSPEGVHQDGFNYIAIVAVNRHNVDGGELLVFDNPGFGEEARPFFFKRMAAGEMAILDDTHLWHSAVPLKAIDAEEQGYTDWLILCANLNQKITDE